MNINRIKALGACALLGGALLATAALASLRSSTGAQAEVQGRTRVAMGLVFRCTPQQLQQIKPAVDSYLQREGVDLRLVQSNLDIQTHTLQYALVEPLADTITLDLVDRPALHITEALVELPMADGGARTVITVSKAEILYAMLQAGRTTVLDGSACDAQALIDQVGIRQNTVAWAESLSWQWPEGGPAVWNKKYWRQGDPVKGYPLHEAINDAFINQDRYAIGCYTATKLVVIQGVLDYYNRIQPNPRMLELVQTQLLQDRDPLSHIEPGVMWHFEADNDEADRARPGKLLALTHGIAAKNFIPGDWAYFLNTDPVTYEKTGYEGSNALYLGRGKFDDYYNDHHHAYTYKEKMHEVYQWRHKVFSSRRDIAKVHPLSAADFEQLAGTPAQGGIQMDYRAVPLLFGFQPLPSVGL
jgi:hypothetical protein